MLKKSIFLLLFFLLFLSLVSVIHAEAIQIRIISEQANVRLKPELNSPILSSIPIGSVLEASLKTDEWYQVTLPPDKNGFVVVGYIHNSEVEEVGEKPLPKPGDKPKTEPPQNMRTSPTPERKKPSSNLDSFKFRIGLGLGAGYGGNSVMFGGNLNFHIIKYLGICIEGFYFSLDNEGNSEVFGEGGLSVGETDIVPLQFSIQGRFPVSSRFTPYVTVGLGYYFCSFQLDGEFKDNWDNLGFTIEETLDGSLGYHAGAGLDFFLNKMLVICLDARYIVLKTGGTWTVTDQVTNTTASGEIARTDFNAFLIGLGVKVFF